MSASARRVVVLPGDGVGPEVTDAATAVLTTACVVAGVELQLEQRRIGGQALAAEGTPLSDATVERCRAADAVLLGAVGGPNWDHLRGQQRCEAGLLRLRSELAVYANLRPVRTHPRLAGRTPLREEVVAGTDLLVVRELTGGIYFGTPKGESTDGGERVAVDTMRYRTGEVERVARVAFAQAQSRRNRLTSVDKANVLATSRLWREVVDAVSVDYPGVKLEHQLVDSCAMRLIAAPRDFDVILAENLFGDILSDEAAVLAGSLGLLPSASIGDTDCGIYEPVHGSAPELAGRGQANPVGAILSVAMLLRISLHLPVLADAVEASVAAVIAQGRGTPDIGGQDSTPAVTEAVCAEVRMRLGAVSPRRILEAGTVT